MSNSKFLILSVLVQSLGVSVDAFAPLQSTSKILSHVHVSQKQQQQRNIRVLETKDETDAAFSAFADSLEEDDDDMFSEDQPLPTWQESLEDLLDPSTPSGKRQILLSELLNANEEIRNDVQSALVERKIDTLLTPKGKKLQNASKAVARQIATDILPGIAELASSSASSGKPPSLPEQFPTLVPKIGSSIFGAISNQAKKQLEILQGDLADPTRIPERLSKQTADLATEAKNIFLETPEGLFGPSYDIVEVCEGYEIRDYEGYTVAETSMAKIGEPYSMDDIVNGGAAFNALAAYIFGGNEEGKNMEMTTPVTTTSVGEMRFYLKKDGSMAATTFPEPLIPEGSFNEQGAVKIVEIPPARLAVATFTGFVTEGEVKRQKDTLLSALNLDGVDIDVPHGAVVPHVVFQYNPPYTIPIVRRNEIAVPVRKLRSDVDAATLESEWGAPEIEQPEEDAEEDDSAPSDVE